MNKLETDTPAKELSEINKAFLERMKNRMYGKSETNHAAAWFAMGWQDSIPEQAPVLQEFYGIWFVGNENQPASWVSFGNGPTLYSKAEAERAAKLMPGLLHVKKLILVEAVN